MEQQSLFSGSKADEAAREREVYEWLKPIIRKLCPELNIHEESFSLNQCEGYSAIKFRSGNVMQIKIRAKSSYISIRKSWLADLPKGVAWEERKSEKGRVRIGLGKDPRQVIEWLGAPMLRAAVLHVPKEFDCCSMVEQCSDARRCVHPDREFSLVCGYRKILGSGQVFFGKNRNV